MSDPEQNSTTEKDILTLLGEWRDYWTAHNETGLATMAGRAADRMSVLEDVCGEIVDIMRTHDEQEAEMGYVDTPGGLEHMGDVWRLLHRWRDRLNGKSP